MGLFSLVSGRADVSDFFLFICFRGWLGFLSLLLSHKEDLMTETSVILAVALGSNGIY